MPPIAQDVVDTITTNPVMFYLTVFLALWPHITIGLRYIVNITPKNWDNAALDFAVEFMKLLAGVVPTPAPEPVDPNSPVAPKRGLLARLLTRK